MPIKKMFAEVRDQYCALVSAARLGAAEDIPLELSAEIVRYPPNRGGPPNRFRGDLWIRKEKSDRRFFLVGVDGIYADPGLIPGDLVDGLYQNQEVAERLPGLLREVLSRPVESADTEGILTAASGHYDPESPVTEVEFFPQPHFVIVQNAGFYVKGLDFLIQIRDNHTLDPKTGTYFHEVWLVRRGSLVQKRFWTFQSPGDENPVKSGVREIGMNHEIWHTLRRMLPEEERAGFGV